MDGLERSPCMEDLRIRPEDVREREDGGCIAVAALSGRGESVAVGSSRLAGCMRSCAKCHNFNWGARFALIRPSFLVSREEPNAPRSIDGTGFSE